MTREVVNYEAEFAEDEWKTNPKREDIKPLIEYLVKERIDTHHGNALDINGKKAEGILTTEGYEWEGEFDSARPSEKIYFVNRELAPQTIEQIKQQGIEIYRKL